MMAGMMIGAAMLAVAGWRGFGARSRALVDLHQQHEQFMGQFLRRFIALSQSLADHHLHDPIKGRGHVDLAVGRGRTVQGPAVVAR